MPRSIATHKPSKIISSIKALNGKKNSYQRGYDRDWYALQRAFLAEHPLCECDQCKAGEIRLMRANVVNHRHDIRDRPDLRLSWNNLQAMNKRCHDRHTRIKQNQQMRNTK